ncbi:hypothetical protein GLOTRDRAFT_137673 [Gloeophyllum trabeum ATCC 11539]|uniref:F-box domain-containing protein n=1 Tax=Gloeophyllum trabeum (strain ATCC 11539 / FP-39264 / Madison 617) TaxID=670483 RepID=S7QD55_GLOTA|nr:uncharacterized protein GLOTRDRAFT_137673 [Gloeophyllum trabeum ATCC 11539]EPQ57323.1 hypothetical protein GLOTRDRAFT_137673 [Gloeophyllum trabeum ATCC 11539]
MSTESRRREAELAATGREELDKKIRQRINELSQLRSQRNELAPVSKLPPEVLAHIFSICSILEPFVIQPPYGTPLHSWFKVTQVCKHWREVALNCAPLWHRIEFSAPKWTVEMLRRSKNAPIVVRADLTYRTPNFVNTVQQALGEVHRIKELDLIAPSQMLSRLAGSLSRPAPALESLRLSSQRLSAYMDTIYHVPDTLFQGRAPRLRRLELVNCEIAWTSGFLANLTHLHIDKATTYDPGRPTMTQFLNVLRNTPALQSLRLKHAAPLDPESIDEDTPRVDLPNLTKVYIQDFVENTSGILKSLNLADNVKMKLECRASSGRENELTELVRMVQGYRLKEIEGRQHLESLRIIIEYGSVQIIGGSLKETAIPHMAVLWTDPSAIPQIDLTLMWHGGSNNERTKAILSAASQSLDLQHVQSLNVYCSEPVPVDSWVSTFAKLTALSSLRLGGYRCSTLIESLARTTPVDRAEHERAPIVFPALSHIGLNDVDWSERLTENMQVDLFGAFRDWLEFRMLREAAVRDITLQNCTSISDGKVAEFKERIRGEVSWDGVDRELSSDDESLDYYGDLVEPYTHGMWEEPSDDEYDVETIFGFPF